MYRKAMLAGVLMVVTMVVPVQGAHHEAGSTATPRQLVESYDSLADVLLAGKKTEWNLVHAILSSTYSHAQATLAAARARLEAGEDAAAEVEKLATLVGQLGTEGDAAVNAVRKRLVDGGHHHHAAPGDEDVYDPGYVIVTRAAKKVLLDAAAAMGRMGGSADIAALEAQWARVEAQFRALHEDASH